MITTRHRTGSKRTGESFRISRPVRRMIRVARMPEGRNPRRRLPIRSRQNPGPGDRKRLTAEEEKNRIDRKAVLRSGGSLMTMG